MELLYVQDHYCCRKALLSCQAGGQSMYDSGQLGLILVTGESPEGGAPVSLSDISDFAATNTIYNQLLYRRAPGLFLFPDVRPAQWPAV